MLETEGEVTRSYEEYIASFDSDYNTVDIDQLSVVNGAAVLAQQVATTYLGRKLMVAEFRSLLYATGVTVVDNLTQNDLTPTYASYKRIDVHALADAIYDMAAPATPTSLTATPQVSRNVNLSWDAVPGATYYQIYWKNTSGQNVVIGTSTTSSFTTPRVAYGDNRFYVYTWADDIRSENYVAVTTTV